MKFRLVDRINGCEPGQFIKGEKSLSLEEYFLLRPAGFSGVFPPTLMAEAFFQLSNFLIFRSFPGRLGYLVMFKKIEFSGYMHPGDTMEMRVDMVSAIDDTAVFKGEGTVNGITVIKGHDFMAQMVDAEKLLNPVKYARLYDSLCTCNTAGL